MTAVSRNVDAMLEMRAPVGLTRCREPRGSWGWSKDFIPQANPKPQLLRILSGTPPIEHVLEKCTATFSVRVSSGTPPLYHILES